MTHVADPGQIVVTYLAAFTGMVIIAVLIGYLLVLLTSYQAREAGSSSRQSGRASRHGGRNSCAVGASGAPVRWTRSRRDGSTGSANCASHTLYPTLVYFRSSGNMRGWVTTLLARMDAACLELAVATDSRDGNLTALIAEGCRRCG